MEGDEQVVRGFRRHASLALLILAVVSSLALILLDATPMSTDFLYVITAIPTILVTWVLIGVRSAKMYIRFARGGLQKERILPGILMVTSILVVLNIYPFLRGCNYLGGALRFAATRSYYEREVALLPQNGKPRLAIFSWGGMMWWSRGVVYDESDEIALPPGQQSAGWKTNTNSGELGCGNWDARALWSHFYLVAFPC